MIFILLALAVAVCLVTILYGVNALKKKKKGNVKKLILASVSVFAMTAIGVIGLAITGNSVLAAPTTGDVVEVGMSMGEGFKYVAAALSTGLATIGTGMAVGSVGSSAIGAVSEDSSILGKTLIFVGMAEGIAIYGMIISILILFV